MPCGRTKDILPPGSLDAATRLVLADAIYFKGPWANPSPEAGTSPQPFHLTASQQIDLPLMHHFDTAYYMENVSFQAVELPYAGHVLSLVALLPRRIDGCGALEAELSLALLSRCLGEMKNQRVALFLPRFKMESDFNLGDTLSKMGLSEAFGPQADISGMDGTRTLNISAVFHKAWVDVSEEGTEAAAATGCDNGTQGHAQQAASPSARLPLRPSFHLLHPGHPFRQPAVPRPTRGPSPLIAATSVLPPMAIPIISASPYGASFRLCRP